MPRIPGSYGIGVSRFLDLACGVKDVSLFVAVGIAASAGFAAVAEHASFPVGRDPFVITPTISPVAG